MARRGLKAALFNDFTGGLNNTEQKQSLAQNESPDCLNIMFGRRGGFALRPGYSTLVHNVVLAGPAYVVGTYGDTTTDYVYGIMDDGGLWFWDGTTLTQPPTANVVDEGRSLRGVIWDETIRFANWASSGTEFMKTYSNSAGLVTLTNVANNNYTAPTGGNAPLARLIANHSGHMWWADTVESANRNKSRLRFSHPLQPGDWADADYFDIEPDDGTNQITALVPLRNVLLVFKRRGVFAVYGTDRDSFVVERVSTQAGAPSQEAVCSSASAAFWWSTDGNVYAYDGQGVTPLGDRIRNVYLNDTVAPGGDHRTWFVDGRVWVSLMDTAGERMLFILDPQVGDAGAWTQFDFAPNSLVWWRRNSGEAFPVFTLAAQSDLLTWGALDQQIDEINGQEESIQGHYTTSWFSGDNPALMKRWRRPTMVAAANDECTMYIDVHRDFDDDTVNRTLTLSINSGGDMVWGDPWGEPWSAAEGETIYEFQRLSSLGRGHAIQLKFRTIENDTRWWVDSYAIPFLQKGYR